MALLALHPERVRLLPLPGPGEFVSAIVQLQLLLLLLLLLCKPFQRMAHVKCIIQIDENLMKLL